MIKMLRAFFRISGQENIKLVLGNPISMCDEDHDVIVRFARGESQLRDQALQIFANHISDLGAHGTLAMKYMSEVDNCVPDYRLKSQLREALLRGEK